MTITQDTERNELVIRTAINANPPLSTSEKTRLVVSENQPITLNGQSVRVQVNATVKVPKTPAVKAK